MEKKSFVMYETYYNTFQRIRKKKGDTAASDFIEAIMNYGLYGEEPPEDSELWLNGLDQMFYNIEKSKENHENAKKGGRKKIEIDTDYVNEEIAKGKTKVSIAKELGISVDTLDRRLKEKAETAKPQNNSAEIIDFEKDSAKTAKPPYININTYTNTN